MTRIRIRIQTEILTSNIAFEFDCASKGLLNRIHLGFFFKEVVTIDILASISMVVTTIILQSLQNVRHF